MQAAGLLARFRQDTLAQLRVKKHKVNHGITEATDAVGNQTLTLQHLQVSACLVGCLLRPLTPLVIRP